MNSEDLSPFKAEMKKRGFTYIKAEDHFINDKGEIAVEIFHPDEPVIFGYNIKTGLKDFESVYFDEPLED